MPQAARIHALYEAIEALPEGVTGAIIHGQPRLSGPLPRPDLALENPVSEPVPQRCQALAWQRPNGANQEGPIQNGKTGQAQHARRL